jgi:hypothetical protein
MSLRSATVRKQELVVVNLASAIVFVAKSGCLAPLAPAHGFKVYSPLGTCAWIHSHDHNCRRQCFGNRVGMIRGWA